MRSFSRHAVATIKTASIPTMPKTAVKMLSMNTFAKAVMGVAHPRMRAAAAGLGHTASLSKGGDVLLK